MEIKLGSVYKVAPIGYEPFLWDFDRAYPNDIEVTVIEPDMGFPSEVEGVFWNNPVHGKIVFVEDDNGCGQWVPLHALKKVEEVVKEEPKFKVGDVVKITKDFYRQNAEDISKVGSLGYVVWVAGHGCQIARWADYDPDLHTEHSLFFIYGTFERV